MSKEMREQINKVKNFGQFLNENKTVDKKSIWDKYGDKLPEIFKQTKYDLPTKEDLIDINSFNLKSDDIIQGFGYTIIGRGMKSNDNKLKVLKSIKLLSDLYPKNEEYIKALKIYEENF